MTLAPEEVEAIFEMCRKLIDADLRIAERAIAIENVLRKHPDLWKEYQAERQSLAASPEFAKLRQELPKALSDMQRELVYPRPPR